MILAGLRSLIFVIFLALTVIPWAMVAVVLSVFVRGQPLYRVCVGWLNLSIAAATWICGVRYQMHGQAHLSQAEQAGAVILLPKHQSTWETFALPGLMPRPLSYVFKRELLRIPFFGWAIGRLDFIHIDRKKSAQAWSRVEEQGKGLMARGHWMIMFPEGTRTARGEQGVYKTGGTRLAVSAGAVVVPIAVTSSRCWPRKSFVLRPGVIDVSVGPPISARGRAPDELMREVEAWVETEMRRLDPQAYPAKVGASTELTA